MGIAVYFLNTVDQMEIKLTGIILAGGLSRRMGTDKGLVLFKGQALIQYPIEIFFKMCSEILISSNSEEYAKLGFKVVPDIYPDIGPMGGIYSCLKQSTNELSLVLSCDMPFVTVKIFNHLLDKRGNSQVCVPWHEKDKFEPLCGVYHNGVLNEMNAFILRKNYKLPDLFKCISFMPVSINKIKPPLSRHYFYSINNPVDLKRASHLSLE
jgi:molybdenum cofactor guanylyltransferase